METYVNGNWVLDAALRSYVKKRWDFLRRMGWENYTRYGRGIIVIDAGEPEPEYIPARCWKAAEREATGVDTYDPETSIVVHADLHGELENVTREHLPGASVHGGAQSYGVFSFEPAPKPSDMEVVKAATDFLGELLRVVKRQRR